MEWLEVEGKTAEAKEEVEKAEKRRNPYRYEPDVLLTGLREWDKRLKAPENFLEGCRRRGNRWIRQRISGL